MPKCEINDCPNDGEKHHILSIGAHGEKADIVENIIYLCSYHHRGTGGIHYLGKLTFAGIHNLQDRFEKARETVWRLEASLKESEV